MQLGVAAAIMSIVASKSKASVLVASVRRRDGDDDDDDDDELLIELPEACADGFGAYRLEPRPDAPLMPRTAQERQPHIPPPQQALAPPLGPLRGAQAASPRSLPPSPVAAEGADTVVEMVDPEIEEVMEEVRVAEVKEEVGSPSAEASGKWRWVVDQEDEEEEEEEAEAEEAFAQQIAPSRHLLAAEAPPPPPPPPDLVDMYLAGLGSGGGAKEATHPLAPSHGVSLSLDCDAAEGRSPNLVTASCANMHPFAPSTETAAPPYLAPEPKPSLLVGNGVVADQDFLTADWDEDDFAD